MIVAAIITFALAAIIGGAVLWRLTPPADRCWVGGCLVATLPMSWLMYHGVRLPLDGWLKAALTEGETLAWLRTAYAPLTEEPAKLWPLLLPFFRRSLTRDNLGRVALALGLGFALGEMLTVANLVIVRQPAVAALPWWQLGGYISERLFSCAIHPAMTALCLWSWRKGRGLALGLLAAMLAHFLCNFPITAAQRGWFGLSPQIAPGILFVLTLMFFLGSVAWLAHLNGGLPALGVWLNGYAHCPDCGTEYARPLLAGLNFVLCRYERCPQCRKWHWTRQSHPANSRRKEIQK